MGPIASSHLKWNNKFYHCIVVMHPQKDVIFYYVVFPFVFFFLSFPFGTLKYSTQTGRFEIEFEREGVQEETNKFNYLEWNTEEIAKSEIANKTEESNLVCLFHEFLECKFFVLDRIIILSYLVHRYITLWINFHPNGTKGAKNEPNITTQPFSYLKTYTQDYIRYYTIRFDIQHDTKCLYVWFSLLLINSPVNLP